MAPDSRAVRGKSAGQCPASLLQQSTVAVLAGGLLVPLEIRRGVIASAETDQSVTLGLLVGVVVQDQPPFIDRIDDRKDRRSIRGFAEGIVADVNRPGLSARVDAPDEDVMTHGHGMDFRLTRPDHPQHAEAAAGVPADVVFEADLAGRFATFVGGHAATIEHVALKAQPPGNVAIFAALMRHSGIIDVVKSAVFDDDVGGAIPEFDGIAEADPQFAIPHRAADMAEIAGSDGHMADAAILIAVDAGIAE